MIGDGENNISLPEIANTLKGRIDAKTRIDILTHGAIYKGNHQLTLKNGEVGTQVTTETFLNEISKEYQMTLYTSIWSCHGGLADKLIINLPSGSLLITHVPEEHVGFQPLTAVALKSSIIHHQELKHYISPFQEFLSKLPYNLLSNVSLNYKVNGRTHHFKIAPDLKVVLHSAADHLKNKVNEFHAFYNELYSNIKSFSSRNKIPDTYKHSFKKEKLSLVEYSKTDLKFFTQGLFLYKCSSEASNVLPSSLDGVNNKADLFNENTLFSATCLHVAAFKKNDLLVKYLLENGADLGSKHFT